MEKAVDAYVKSKEKLLKYFQCSDDYYIKFLGDNPWMVSEDSGIFFLTYWTGNIKTDAVIVKKDDRPLIYKTGEYTMIIAIDCVKIAFVLNNGVERRSNGWLKY